MTQLQEVHEDAPKLRADRIALALAQIPDLLDQVRQVELEVRPRRGELLERTHLGARPGVEVALVEIVAAARPVEAAHLAHG